MTRNHEQDQRLRERFLRQVARRLFWARAARWLRPPAKIYEKVHVTLDGVELQEHASIRYHGSRPAR